MSPPVRVIVPAADFDRAAQVLEVRLPAGSEETAVFEDESGRTYPVQRPEGGRSVFMIPWQASGETLVLRASRLSGVPASAGVVVEQGSDELAVSVDGRAVLGYRTRTGVPEGVDPVFARAAFIHPVLSPGGVRVTEAFPPNHLHQNGIWTAWTSTRFRGEELDFWNLRKRQGRVEFERLESSFQGPVFGGFAARHAAMDIRSGEPATVLSEQWHVTLLASPGDGPHVFDLEAVQTNVTDAALELNSYHYGGMGLRGHEQWDGSERAFFLTSEGETDRVKAHGQRMRWCHIGGIVDGKLAGVAILGHPANFRAPQPVRIHPNEPFFCFTPAPLGPFRIEPDESHVMRYRFVVSDGPPEARRIEAFWNGFARPAAPSVDFDD